MNLNFINFKSKGQMGLQYKDVGFIFSLNEQNKSGCFSLKLVDILVEIPVVQALHLKSKINA